MRARNRAALAALAYLVAFAVNRSLVEVRGASMEPTLREGDRLVTLPAWLLRPAAGRIVVVADPTDPSHRVVKRLLDVDAVSADVRGDAPHRSTDSRAWGRIPRSKLRRVAVARWPWPASGGTVPQRGRRATTSTSGSSSPTSPTPRRP